MCPLLNSNNWMYEVSKKPEMKNFDTCGPTVSIIMPSYNQVQYIETSIRSVIFQDYRNIEFIVIDGGSDDGTVEILKKYDASIQYWVSERDNGQTQAINKGLKKSKGSIVAYLNSDDIYWHCGVVSGIVEVFMRNNSLDMVYGGVYIINELSIPVRKVNHAKFDRIKLERDVSYYIPQQGVFFTQQAFQRIGPFDESLHFKMDREFYLRLAREGRVEYIPEPLAGFRTHAQAKSNPRNVLAGWKELIYVHRKHHLPFTLKSKLYCFMSFAYSLMPSIIRNFAQHLRYRSDHLDRCARF